MLVRHFSTAYLPINLPYMISQEMTFVNKKLFNLPYKSEQLIIYYLYS